MPIPYNLTSCGSYSIIPRGRHQVATREFYLTTWDYAVYREVTISFYFRSKWKLQCKVSKISKRLVFEQCLVKPPNKCLLLELYHHFMMNWTSKCMYAQLHEADSNILCNDRGTEGPGKLNVWNPSGLCLSGSLWETPAFTVRWAHCKKLNNGNFSIVYFYVAVCIRSVHFNYMVRLWYARNEISEQLHWRLSSWRI